MESEAHYICKRKLPSKWVWLHRHTSAAHRELHCSPSVGLSSQTTLTALLLSASQTDVPTLSQFALPCSLSANPHQTMEMKNAAVSEDDGGCCFAGNDWVELPTHSVAVPHSATRHNRAINRDAKQHMVGAGVEDIARAGARVNQDYEEISP